MISEEALNILTERLVKRIDNLNEYMIEKLAEQIKTIGSLTPSQLREVYQSIKYGNDLNEIIRTIAELLGRNEKDIINIFEEVAKQNQAYAKKFYKYREMPFIPYEENVELQTFVKSIAARTLEEYRNISKTTAMQLLKPDGTYEDTPISRIYQELTDEAIISATTGRESYQTAMKNTLTRLADKGIYSKVEYASGHRRSLDAAVRLNIMEGIRTLENEIQKKFGEEFGADGYEVVHHKNPAPDHSSNIKAGWHDMDGKQFAKEEFEKLNGELNRPISTLNCYHFIIPIILGVSKPIYDEETLKQDKEANLKGFTFEGKHYTNYEGTQLQRALERKIRHKKRQYTAFKNAGWKEDAMRVKQHITELKDKYYELAKTSGLPTKQERLISYRFKGSK